MAHAGTHEIITGSCMMAERCRKRRGRRAIRCTISLIQTCGHQTHTPTTRPCFGSKFLRLTDPDTDYPLDIGNLEGSTLKEALGSSTVQIYHIKAAVHVGGKKSQRIFQALHLPTSSIDVGPDPSSRSVGIEGEIRVKSRLFRALQANLHSERRFYRP